VANEHAYTLPQALRRIDELEGYLAQHRRMLTSSLATLQTIYSSEPYHLSMLYWRLRNRLFPAHSPQTRAFRLLSRGLRKFTRVLPKRPPKVVLRSVNQGYARWIRQTEPGPAQLEEQRLTEFAYRPKISILVALHNPAEPHLREMLHSVLGQTYTHWELCLADGGSRPPVAGQLGPLLETDRRIRLLELPANLGSAGNWAAALASATGAYVALLDQDDTLAPFALFEIVRTLNQLPEADFLYSDEDALSRTLGRRKHPHFKPDWSPDTLRNHNYIGHLAVLRRALVEQVGGFRPGYEGHWNYDLILRASEQAAHIVHLPKILYHRRKHARNDSPARGEACRKALAEHLGRTQTSGEVKTGLRPGTFQVIYPLASKPLVSIIIPNKDQPQTLQRCLESIRRSSYGAYEIVIAENRSEQAETLALYERLALQPDVRIVRWDRPFNYSAVNNFGVRHAAGDVLLFLNNDVQVINADWLERLLEHALRPEVGAVGAKLYYPDGTVQSAGSIIGIYHGAGHYQRFFPGRSAGYGHRLVTVQNLSAVTGACLMMRKAVFEEVGGFEELLVVTFNDMDLCLKVRQQGYRVIWTPHAELVHFECTTRGLDVTAEKQARCQYEMSLFQWKWGDVLKQGDPYYNPNLTLDREDCSLRL
jgi:GT2 family glycosyltransferase